MLRRNIGWVVAALLAVATGGLAAAFVHERSIVTGKAPATTVQAPAQPSQQAVTRLRGKVTAVDATTLTVRGRDGSTKTFTLDRATRYGTPQKALTKDAVKVGETVIVVSGNAQSATPAARRVIVAPGGQGAPASTA